MEVKLESRNTSDSAKVDHKNQVWILVGVEQGKEGFEK